MIGVISHHGGRLGFPGLYKDGFTDSLDYVTCVDCEGQDEVQKYLTSMIGCISMDHRLTTRDVSEAVGVDNGQHNGDDVDGFDVTSEGGLEVSDLDCIDLEVGED